MSLKSVELRVRICKPARHCGKGTPRPVVNLTSKLTWSYTYSVDGLVAWERTEEWKLWHELVQKTGNRKAQTQGKNQNDKLRHSVTHTPILSLSFCVSVTLTCWQTDRHIHTNNMHTQHKTAQTQTPRKIWKWNINIFTVTNTKSLISKSLFVDNIHHHAHTQFATGTSHHDSALTWRARQQIRQCTDKGSSNVLVHVTQVHCCL